MKTLFVVGYFNLTCLVKISQGVSKLPIVQLAACQPCRTQNHEEKFAVYESIKLKNPGGGYSLNSDDRDDRRIF